MTIASQTTARRVTADSFWRLCAADLMTAPVLNIPHDTSLREAARLLQGSHISGAPVIDQHGHCLGVLSSNDFVTWAGDDERRPQGPASHCGFIAPWGEMIDIDDSPELEIQHYMRSPPIAVDPATPLGELAQLMVDSHIHRVLVAADQDRLCGVVSSTDVLAALAGAARDTAGLGQND
ncbi:MAG: CBS domain-containing protein [Planctomycetaceae bacterium]